MRVVGDINKYISATEPWKIKDNPARLGTVLHVAAQAVSDANHLLAPFLPHSAQKVWELSAAQARSRRCHAWKRSRISTSRASCIRSSPATTSWAKPCIRGLPSRSWPELRCRSRIRSSRRFRRRRRRGARPLRYRAEGPPRSRGRPSRRRKGQARRLIPSHNPRTRRTTLIFGRFLQVVRQLRCDKCPLTAVFRSK